MSEVSYPLSLPDRRESNPVCAIWSRRAPARPIQAHGFGLQDGCRRPFRRSFEGLAEHESPANQWWTASGSNRRPPQGVPISAFLSVKSPADVPASSTGRHWSPLCSFARRLHESISRCPEPNAERSSRHSGAWVSRSAVNVADNGIALDIHSQVAAHMQSDGAERIDAGMRAALAGQTMARPSPRGRDPRREARAGGGV